MSDLPKKLPAARKVDVCVAGQCRHGTLYANGPPRGDVSKRLENAFVRARRLHGLGPYPVSVTVLDRHGKVLLRVERQVKMEKFSPNGVVCGPTCFVADLKLNVGRRVLEQPPRRVPVGE